MIARRLMERSMACQTITFRLHFCWHEKMSTRSKSLVTKNGKASKRTWRDKCYRKFCLAAATINHFSGCALYNNS